MKKIVSNYEEFKSLVRPYELMQSPMVVTIKPYKETRSVIQNAKMWAMLSDISKQVDWYGKKPTPDEWKQIITAAIRKQEVVPGIEGGFVILGQSTSKMTIKQMIDVVDYAYAFGSSKDVVWTDPADIVNYMENR